MVKAINEDMNELSKIDIDNAYAELILKLDDTISSINQMSIVDNEASPYLKQLLKNAICANNNLLKAL